MARELTKAERAALLLFSLGEERAAAVLKHIEPKDVQVIGFAMARLADISPIMVDDVLEEIIVAIKNLSSLGIESDGYIRKMLVQALGEEKATGIIERIFVSSGGKGIEQLKWMDTLSVADLVRLEHPQIGAIILSLLGSDKASEVMAKLPENIRSDLLIRIATMQGVQPSALRELDEIMEKQLSGSETVKATVLGGVDVAANILNFMDGVASSFVLAKVSENDAELALKIQDKMFVFEDLASMSASAMQTVLREVQTGQLLLALRGATDSLKEKIYSNMSKRAADILKDDLEASPPAKLSEVELAQKEILSIVKGLVDTGTIQLGGDGTDDLI
ncbi:MAG: flagellar motor switch protein FliG [Methylococcales bacterium]|jgi:flagellar motor switch protein FliG|nr:MAG: flagellar motor switch protein FliG [Methylococcales bacterium]